MINSDGKRERKHCFFCIDLYTQTHTYIHISGYLNFKLAFTITSVVIVIKKICPYGDRQQPLETAMHSIIHIQLPEECARSALPVQSIGRSAFF